MLNRFSLLFAFLMTSSNLCVMAQETATISGTIVLEDGSPSSAEGYLYYDSKRDSSGYSGTVGRFTNQFSFKARPGIVWLRYHPKEYAPAWLGPLKVNPGATISDLKIVLRNGFTQRLNITDVEGTPIPNVTIVAHPEINGSAQGPVREKTTDEEGSFLYKHLADTRYVFNLTAPGFQPLTSDPIELEPDADLPVHMLRANLCTGTILYPDGAPAAQTKLRMRHEWTEDGKSRGYSGGDKGFWGKVVATTNDQGEFELNQLRDGSDYLFLIEGADESRVIVHQIEAGKESLQIKFPPRRDLLITVTGDMSQLPQRRGEPYAVIRQRIRVRRPGGGTYGDLVGEDISIEPTEQGGKAIFRGLPVDLNSEAVEEQVEVSLGYSRTLKQKVSVNPDAITEVHFELPDQHE